MTERERDIIGWREWVALPELAPAARIKAKIDTGAATSSIHAYRLRVFDTDDGPVAHFEIHPKQRSRAGTVEVEVPVVGQRRVRSSNGQSEMRPVIRTTLNMGGRSWPIELTLTARDEMGFRMLIGRKALRRHAIVDVSRSYVAGTPASLNRA